MTEPPDIRARWKQAEPVLEADRRDRRAHLDQPIGERLLQTIRLGDATIRWFPDPPR